MITTAEPLARHTKYQRHIDGLRALAVLVVVFYHFEVPAFGGGFVGVDVFFVISGYLITGLIMEEIASTGRFGFGRFYARRVRRLFPAMLATLAVSLLLALLLFSPVQIQRFGYSLAATALSVSNLYFWSEAGYFDVSSSLKPLLHTWSLAVEEQFYLLWPALIWLLCRGRSRASIICLLLLIGFGSLTLNLIWIEGEFDENATSTLFYLTPFRIYEFVIGAMGIFLLPIFRDRLWLQEIAMPTGLGLIAWSVLTFSETNVFPGTAALIPCAGALLVIVSGNSRLLSWILTNRVAVGCGLISYSIYLTHWPLLVFYQYFVFRPLEQIEYALLLALTLLLSCLLYRFVESRFRWQATTARVEVPGRPGFLTVNLGLMLSLCLAGTAIGLAKNLLWGKGETLSAQAAQRGHEQRFEPAARGCSVLTLDDPTRCDLQRPFQLLIIGNSHEVDAYNAFYEVYGNDPRVNLISFGGLNKCRLEFSSQGPSSPIAIRDCDQRFATLREANFVNSLNALVLSLNNPFGDQLFIGNKRPAWKVIHHLRSINQKLPLVVMGSYINTVRDCAELFNRFHSFDACKNREFIATTGYGERQSSTLPEASATDYLYIDKMKILCPSGSLESCIMQANGEPAFYDDGHLSLGFSRYLGERISKDYAAQLAEFGFP
tara:strand:+ start:253 stop:2235 length:1983 start_codon:yes stop_codon:yes gene_type:complete